MGKPLWKRKKLTPTIVMAAQAHKSTGKTIPWIADELRITEKMVLTALRTRSVESDMPIMNIREVIADKFMQKAGEMIEAITPDKIAESSAKDCAVAAGILHQQARLADGKSTSNVMSLSVIVEKAARIREGQDKELQPESTDPGCEDVVIEAGEDVDITQSAEGGD